MALAALGHQHRRRELQGVVAHDPEDQVEQRRLPVGDATEQEGDQMLAGEPGEAITQKPAHEGDDIVVALEYVLQKPYPVRAGAATGRYSRQMGHKIAVMLPQGAGT